MHPRLGVESLITESVGRRREETANTWESGGAIIDPKVGKSRAIHATWNVNKSSDTKEKLLLEVGGHVPRLAQGAVPTVWHIPYGPLGGRVIQPVQGGVISIGRHRLSSLCMLRWVYGADRVQGVLSSIGTRSQRPDELVENESGNVELSTVLWPTEVGVSTPT